MADHKTAIFSQSYLQNKNGKDYAWIDAVYVVGTED